MISIYFIGPAQGQSQETRIVTMKMVFSSPSYLGFSRLSKISLLDFGSDFQSRQNLNTNNQTIETGFDNTLSRDGTSPNQMLSVLDMNSHRIINQSSAVTGSDSANLNDVNLAVAAGYAGFIYQTITAITSTYATARAFPVAQLINGGYLYIRGNSATADGGEGVFRITTVNPSWADDSGSVLAHSSGTFWLIRVVTDYISINWFGPSYTNGGNSGPAIRAAIAATKFFNCKRVTFWGILYSSSQVTNATFGWTLPSGLILEGISRTSTIQDQSTDTCELVYQGANDTYMFDVRSADSAGGINDSCDITFKNFKVANGLNGFVALNQLRQNGSSYVPGANPSPNYIQSWKFQNVKGSGGYKNSFLLAKQCFEIVVDWSCEISNYLRGVDLTGCDTCYISGRYQGNASRHVSIQKQGTFGNSNTIQANLMTTFQGSDATENHYAIFDSAESTTIYSPYIEMDGANTFAAMYIGGNATTIISPKIYSISSAVPYFHLGPNAVNCKMISPDTQTFSSISAPIIDATSNFTYPGTGFDNYNIQIINPSTNVTIRLCSSKRCQIINGSNKLLGLGRTSLYNVGLSVNGVGLKRYQITAQDPGPITGIVIGPTGVTTDATAGNYAGQAITMPAANDGFVLSFVMGRDIAVGDSVSYRVLARCSAVPGSGNISTFFRKNGTPVTTSVTTALATYSVLAATLSTAGYVAGDIVDIAVVNNVLSGATGLVGMVELINNS